MLALINASVMNIPLASFKLVCPDFPMTQNRNNTLTVLDIISSCDNLTTELVIVR